MRPIGSGYEAYKKRINGLRSLKIFLFVALSAYCIETLWSMVGFSTTIYRWAYYYLATLFASLIVVFILAMAFSHCSFDLAGWKIKLYQVSYSYHKFVWKSWIALIAGSLAYGAMMKSINFLGEGYSWLGSILLWPVLLGTSVWLPLFVAWCTLFPWHSSEFRYLAWWGSKHLGLLYKWITTGWRWIAPLLVFVALVRMALSSFTDKPMTWSQVLSLEFAIQVVIIASLLLMLNWAYSLNKSVVIMPFIDYTGDANLKTGIEGIASKLQDELAQLRKDYCTVKSLSSDRVNEEAPNEDGNGNYQTKYWKLSLSKKLESLRVVSSAENVGQTLQGIFSPQSEVSVGLISIPVGSIVGAVAEVTHGPRLSGSVHKERNELILISSIEGGGLSKSWRITSDEAAKEISKERSSTDGERSWEYLEDRRDLLDDQVLGMMLKKTAKCIFNDLNANTPSRQAIFHYADGLRTYCGPLPREEKSYEKRSERDDSELALIRKKSVDAAMVDLERAIGLDPRLSEAYCALAQIFIDSKEFDAALRTCRRSIRLKPDDARIRELECTARQLLNSSSKEGYRPGHEIDCRKEYSICREILDLRRVALGLAWRWLCISAIKGEVNEDAKETARTCALNLAEMHQRMEDYGKSKELFKLALHLDPLFANSYFRYALMLDEEGRWRDAAVLLQRALLYDEKPVFFARLSYIHSNLFLSWLASELKQPQSSEGKALKAGMTLSTKNMLDKHEPSRHPSNELLKALECEIRRLLGLPVFYPHEIANPEALASKLLESKDLISVYIRSKISKKVRRSLKEKLGSSPPNESLKVALADQLNSRLRDRHLSEEGRFGSVNSAQVRIPVELNPQEEDLMTFNRLILEAAYATELPQRTAMDEQGKRAILQTWRGIVSRYEAEAGEDIRLARYNYMRAMENPSLLPRDNELFWYIKKALARIGDLEEYRRVNSIPTFLKKLNKLFCDKKLDKMKDLRNSCRDWKWAYAQVSLKIAEYYEDAYKSSRQKFWGEMSERYLKTAIERLEDDHSKEIRERRLYHRLESYKAAHKESAL